MPETFSFEEATAPGGPSSFSFEEATQESKRLPADFQSPFNAYVQEQVRAADASHPLYNPLSGGYTGNPTASPEQDIAFSRSIAQDPVGFAKSLPTLPFKALTGAGHIAYATAADTISSLFGDPQYGGNIKSLESGEDTLPAERFIGEAAKTNPDLALTAKLGEAATEMAPALGLAGLPSGVNRLLAAGFSADMIAHSPQLFREYAEEINKPESEQDPAKLNELKAAVIQNFTFAPLAGAGAVHDIPITRGEKIAFATRELGKQLNTPPSSLLEGPPKISSAVDGLREVGVRMPGPDVMEESGLRDLASQALREAQTPIEGEYPAVERLRNLRELREQEIPDALKRVGDRPGGGPAEGGQVSFAAPAAAEAIPSARQSALIDYIRSQGSLEQPPNLVQQIQKIVNNKDRLGLEEMRAEISKTAPGIGTRSQANDALRVIDQRLDELKTGQVHVENEALRRILRGKPGRPPTVEASPPPERPKGFISGTAVEDWANEVLKGGAAHGGPDVLAAYGVKGAALIERGIRNFSEWSAEMIKQFGESIKPHLEQLWGDATGFIEKGVPDALESKATQVLRTVQEQPGKSQGQVPVSEGGRAAGVGGSAEASVADVPKKIADQMGFRYDSTMLGRWMFTALDKEGKPSTSFVVKEGSTPEQIREKYEQVRKSYGDQPDAPRPLKSMSESAPAKVGDFEFKGVNKGGPGVAELTAEQRAKLSPKDAANYDEIFQKYGSQLEYTDPESGLTFYAPEGSTPEQIRTIHDDFLERSKANEAAAKKMRQGGVPDHERFGIEPPKPGMVRLYNGTFLSSGSSGAWWTDSPQRAGSFGNKVQYLDVPESVAAEAKAAARERGQGGSSYLIKDQQLAKSGKPVPKPPMQAAHEIDFPAEKSAMDKLIERLEGMKATGDSGQVFSLPHPDAIKAIGRATWNTAIDIAVSALKAGKTIAEAIDAAFTHIKRNASGFDEAQLRANLDSILRAEGGSAERGGTSGGKPVAPSGRARTAGLGDIYARFQPEPKTGTTLGQRITGAVEAIRTGFSSRFRPLDKLASDIQKAYGQTTQKLAGIFEQLKGATGKAEADVYRFDQDVSNLVGNDTQNFNAYMFLRRSLDRLQQDLRDIQTAQAGGSVGKLNRRSVSDYTIPELQAKLATLIQQLEPEQARNFERAAELYQAHMDRALQLQVQSGRMSQEVHNAIKRGNQFYAPFKILKYLDETSRPDGSGRKIDTTADYTKAMEGIEDPNFKLGDMLSAARQNITMSRVLAEKNRAMVRFANVASQDRNGLFVKRVGPQETAPAGKKIVNVMQNGEMIRLAVDPSVADAVQLFNPPSNEALANFLRYTAMPFRAGATVANLSFQAVNLLLADAPRAALVSKYGVRGAADLIRYPLDMAHAFLSAMEGNLLRRENKLYLDYLDSGAAGAVIQDYLTPDNLKYRGPNTQSLPAHIARTVIDSVPRFAKAIEETSKMIGIKRAMRMEGVESGAELARRVPEAVTEVRRFSGSPDFGRQGKWVESARLNLMFMFLNARIQGAVADMGRLAGRDGAQNAALMWGRLGTAIGVPTAALWYINHLPQYKHDYDLRPKNEKDNYWLIPKDDFITDDQGNKVRDYWRIPKREAAQILANLVESAIKFGHDRDPEAAWAFGVDAMENLSPLNIRGKNMTERMESMLSSLNPAIKAPLEAGTGRDTFQHRDIVPEQMKKASPENQYFDRTPMIYRKLAQLMPDVAPDALRSPLMLQNLTQNFTANLIEQFLPSKGVKGREGFAANPLMRRFVSVPYTEDPAEKQSIQNLQRESADEFLTRDRAARELYPSAQTPQDLAKAVAQKYGMEKQGQQIFERSLDLWIADRNGVTRQDRALLALPTQERAKYILDKVKTMDPQSKIDLLLDYERKRIITDGVIDSMIEQAQPH